MLLSGRVAQPDYPKKAFYLRKSLLPDCIIRHGYNKNGVGGRKSHLQTLLFSCFITSCKKKSDKGKAVDFIKFLNHKGIQVDEIENWV